MEDYLGYIVLFFLFGIPIAEGLRMDAQRKKESRKRIEKLKRSYAITREPANAARKGGGSAPRGSSDNPRGVRRAAGRAPAARGRSPMDIGCALHPSRPSGKRPKPGDPEEAQKPGVQVHPDRGDRRWHPPVRIHIDRY